jgi:hypothetical protein
MPNLTLERNGEREGYGGQVNERISCLEPESDRNKNDLERFVAGMLKRKNVNEILKCGVECILFPFESKSFLQITRES